MRIDHVIWATADLDAAAVRFEREHGLRADGVPDPSGDGPYGGITWVEVAGDPARLDAWLGGAELPVRVLPGAPALLAVGIGEQELR